MEKFLGKDVEVLIETSDSTYSIGHTSNFLLVKALGVFQQEEKVLVQLDQIEYPYCLGTIKERIKKVDETLVTNG